MTDNMYRHDKLKRLRQQAEAMLAGEPRKCIEDDTDILNLIHELQVHQTELELQNEELQRCQQEIFELQQQFKDLYESAPCGYITLNNKGIFTKVNRKAINLLVGKEENLLGSTLRSYIKPGWEHLLTDAMHRVAKNSKPESVEIPMKLHATPPPWLQAEIKADLGPEGELLQWRIILLDISDRKATEFSLEEKEVMIKEIHHRVRNNMQVISSLISLHANEIPESEARELFESVKNRIQAMAIIHDKLYQSSNLAKVEFDEYARSLLRFLLYTHKTDTEVELELDLEPAELPLQLALPCGLILNELFCNAMKHAFAGRRKGVVSISLHAEPSEGVNLCVRDDGVGLPPDLNWNNTKTLGLRLVKMLAEQIEAEVKVSSVDGASFTVIF